MFAWWRHRQAAANAANALTASPSSLSAGPPLDVTGNSSSSTVPAGGYLNTNAWLGAVLAGLGPGSYNDFIAWLNGNCVRSNTAVAAIQQAIQQFGLPPGFGTPPPITLCPSAGTPPGSPPKPAAAPTPPPNILREFTLIANPGLVTDLLKQGYNVFTFGNAQYYNPASRGAPGHGNYWQWIPTPQLANEYRAAGRQVISIGSGGSGAEYVLV